MIRPERPPIIFEGEVADIGEVQELLKNFFVETKKTAKDNFTSVDEKMLRTWYAQEYKNTADRLRGKKDNTKDRPPLDISHHAAIISSVLGELRIKTEQLIHDRETKAERLNPLLYTRAGMRKRLETSLENIKKEPSEGKKRFVVLVNIDLDDFKVVNDNFDHEVGDEVLRRLGGALEKAVRPDDAVAHYSGDEFGFMMEMELDTNSTPEQVHAIVEKAIKRIIETAQAMTWEKEITPGNFGIRPDGKKQELSAGYSIITADQTGSPEDYSKDADKGSELSKILRIIREIKGQTIESADRVVDAGRTKKVEEGLDETERLDAQFIRNVKRGLQERFPKIPRQILFDMVKEQVIPLFKAEEARQLLAEAAKAA